ncbi:hypothetical protein B0H16DRAFT_1577381 [Mycena metata]|uniref:Uncharacterized protein n=1 Tax=Mycena metata TaxID=1033252 RepID=A0AAD7I5X4_9AGAR|nr:hypothetical protein B0H16DRAFT_1577381 [Mycena metata]
MPGMSSIVAIGNHLIPSYSVSRIDLSRTIRVRTYATFCCGFHRCLPPSISIPCTSASTRRPGVPRARSDRLADAIQYAVRLDFYIRPCPSSRLPHKSTNPRCVALSRRLPLVSMLDAHSISSIRLCVLCVVLRCVRLDNLNFKSSLARWFHP